MYRQTVQQLINELAETEEFFRAGIVAIQIPTDFQTVTGHDGPFSRLYHVCSSCLAADT